MKKKIKLLSALSTTIATTSLIATSCAVVNKNSNGTTTNGTDISTIPWVQRSFYNSTNQSQIESTVLNDNTTTFAHYEGLLEAVTITANIDSPSTGQVTILITTSGTTYTNSASWVANCKSPEPELIDINTLNWKMRTFYNATDSETIVTTIETDNSDSSGAGIVSWDDINVNATVVDSEISINIIVDNANTIYTGAVRWSAAIEKYEVWSDSITDTSYKGRSTLVALKQGRQVTLSFNGSKETETGTKDVYILLVVPDAWLPTMSATNALINYDTDTPTGMVWLNSGEKTLKIHPTTNVLEGKRVAFTLTYIAIS